MLAVVGPLENLKNELYLQREVLEALLCGYMERTSAWLL